MSEKWRNGMKKILGSKETMLIVFLSGILIFVILLPTDKNNKGYEKKQQDANLQDTAMEDNNSSDYYDYGYKEKLENELEEFLSGVAGVGEAKVLIYMNASQEYIVEKDSPTVLSESGERKDKSVEETTVYTVNSDGKQVPFVSQTKKPAVDGVVVAAEGASQENIRLQIVRLVMALFGVEANKVEVFTLE